MITYVLVCRDCIKGRKVLSSTVIPADERNHSIGATISTGGRMQGDCGHRAFVLYTVRPSSTFKIAVRSWVGLKGAVDGPYRAMVWEDTPTGSIRYLFKCRHRHDTIAKAFECTSAKTKLKEVMPT